MTKTRLQRPILAGLALVLLLLPGCAHFTTPMDSNLHETNLGDKTGRAHWESVLSLFAWGDAGTRAAAEEGGIEVVNHADVETFAILFGLIYLRRTTIVYGE